MNGNCVAISVMWAYILLLWLEHDHGQTDSRARAQRLSAAHHKVTWSILIGFIYREATPTLCKGKCHCIRNVSVLRK